MKQRKRKRETEVFYAEMPGTLTPPTLVQQPARFVEALRQRWGRGGSILLGAVLMGVGFFVLAGAAGTTLGVLGAALVAGALLWERLSGR